MNRSALSCHVYFNKQCAIMIFMITIQKLYLFTMESAKIFERFFKWKYLVLVGISFLDVIQTGMAKKYTFWPPSGEKKYDR